MLERVRQWAKDAPEEWGELPVSTQKTLLALEVPTDPSESAERKAGRWGLLAYLGLHMDGFYADITSHKRKLRWQNFGRSAPQDLLDHESTPGLPDGWLLLAGLYHRSVARYTGNRNEEAGQNMVNLWSDRLLKGVPEADQDRHWRLNMLKAAGVMMENRGVGNTLKRSGLAGFTHEIMCTGTIFRGDRPVSPELRRELSAVLLSSRAFRSFLATALFPLLFEEGLTQPWTEGVSSTALWEGMLGLYHQVFRRNERESERHRTSTHFLEKTMQGWVRQGFLPTGLQDHKVRAGLEILAQRQPEVRSALMVGRLERSVNEANVQPRRHRM